MREHSDCGDTRLIMQVSETGREKQPAPPCSFPDLAQSESFSVDFGGKHFAVTLGYEEHSIWAS